VATIIAEIGLNHNGNMQLAHCLIDEAAAAGADVAKFQFFDVSKYFGPEFEWYDACMAARLDLTQAAELKAHCDAIGIEFCASAFDVQGVEWCERLGVKRHKLASRCIGQDDVIAAMARTGKPMIVSLGMWQGSGFPAIDAVGPVQFLYCIAKYPTEPADVDFASADFRTYAGFSDHTIGTTAAKIALARGAGIIEKHFTLSKRLYGPDQRGSAEPHELREIVEFARAVQPFVDRAGMHQ
jgi:N-acetylneuraminate synthase/N,N'-diacetyllegionaminate synthase